MVVLSTKSSSSGLDTSASVVDSVASSGWSDVRNIEAPLRVDPVRLLPGAATFFRLPLVFFRTSALVRCGNLIFVGRPTSAGLPESNSKSRRKSESNSSKSKLSSSPPELVNGGSVVVILGGRGVVDVGFLARKAKMDSVVTGAVKRVRPRLGSGAGSLGGGGGIASGRNLGSNGAGRVGDGAGGGVGRGKNVSG